MAESIEAQLGAIFDEYEQLANDTVEQSARKAARDAVQKLKNTSPKKTGSYAAGWSSKKTGSIKGIGSVGGYVVHNRTDYQLTHLLENGHVIRNKYGTYGRAPAHKHIAPVAEQGASEFEENVRRNLSK